MLWDEDDYESWQDVESKKFFIGNFDWFDYKVTKETEPSLELKCLVVEAARQTCHYKEEKKMVAKRIFKNSRNMRHSIAHTATFTWLSAAMRQLKTAAVTNKISCDNTHVLLIKRVMLFMADCYVINKIKKLDILKELQGNDWAESVRDVLKLAEEQQWTELTTAARAAQEFCNNLDTDWSQFDLDIEAVMDEED